MPLYSFYETELRGFYQIGVANNYPASRYEPEDFYFRETNDYIHDYEKSIVKLTELLSEDAQIQKSDADERAEPELISSNDGADDSTAEKLETLELMPDPDRREFYDKSADWQLRQLSGTIERITSAGVSAND